MEVRSAPSHDGTSSLWQSRVLSGRLAINPGHDDFPALLAKALDAVDAAEYDINQAADSLAISMSQLVKFLKHEPAALSTVNQGRRQRGLRPLH
jgi:hypothetical protein